ncbi:MAG: hypothetical protein ACTHVO_11730, partial [Brevibacterium yomogidense]
RFARNQALSNGRNCDLLPTAALTNGSTLSHLPSAMVALYELLHLQHLIAPCSGTSSQLTEIGQTNLARCSPQRPEATCQK